eukprot:TRINITY_DN32495_c0_g1_i1.p1 TRINITY_DN32495_c0_g1~~TRINITY_DN32495_c0_g1_i1.p1  ORF type:complete len:473 (+),score=61.52 TRINITY_DN32495_c0_g1_i1:50-1420(+)
MAPPAPQATQTIGRRDGEPPKKKKAGSARPPQRSFSAIMKEKSKRFGHSTKDFCFHWFDYNRYSHDSKVSGSGSQTMKSTGISASSNERSIGGNPKKMAWSSSQTIGVGPTPQQPVDARQLDSKWTAPHEWAKQEAHDNPLWQQDPEDQESNVDIIDVIEDFLPEWVVFMPLHVSFVFGLWLIFTLRDGSSLAGLESLWPEMTDLRTYDDCKDLRSQVWRWISYQFSHVGFFHVGINCFMIGLFGWTLERRQGSVRVVGMYYVGVFGGALCYFVADVHTKVVGASGGVYALVGVEFSDALMNLEERFAKTRIVAIVFVCAVDVLVALLTRGSGVSHAAHFGGGVAGVLIGIVIGRNKRLEGHERKVQFVSFILGVGLIVFCFVWLSKWAPRTVFDGTPWCWARQVRSPDVFGDGKYHCIRCDGIECIQQWNETPAEFIHKVSLQACKKAGWSFSGR